MNAPYFSMRSFGVLICLALMAGCASQASRNGSALPSSEAFPIADSNPQLLGNLAPPVIEPETRDARANPWVERALSALGTRYRYGGNSPESGFDCSGFVRWIFASDYPELPRSSQAISNSVGIDVDKNALQPSDLLFFRISRTRSISHVGMYVGDGQFVHAPSTGGRVRVEPLDTPYWRARLVKARRLPGVPSTISSNASG